MDIPDVYQQTRAQLLALAGELDAVRAATPVPATPGWTVRDIYAHLAGVCADVLDGRMEGSGTPEWTARQLAERSNDDLTAITAAWSARGPDFDAFMRAQGDAAPPFPSFDVWTHQRDIMGALDRPRAADERASLLAARALQVMSDRARVKAMAAVRVVTRNNDAIVGAGEPVATLSTADDEVLRMIFGRRSRTQMASAGWDVEPGDALETLHLFDVRDDDLAD